MAWPRPDLPINQQEISPNDFMTWQNEMAVIPAANRPGVVASNPPLPNVMLAPVPSGDTTGVTDGAAIQGRIDAATALATGGTVLLAAGRYYGTITLKPNVRLQGAGMLQTFLTTPAGSSADTVQGLNFLTLTGKAYAAGDYALGARNVEIRDLCVDGNRAGGATGWCARIWSGFIHMHNVEFRNGQAGNLWTEFTDVDNFLDPLQQDDLNCSNIRLQNSGGHGWVNRGPHDGVVVGFLSWNHAGTSLRAEMAAYLGTYGAGIAVTAATTAGTIATFTTGSHVFAVGQQVTVSGVTPAGYNGTWRVLSVSNPTDPFAMLNTFTADIGTSPGALSVAGLVSGVRGFNGACSITYANSFLCLQGSYYSNCALRLYGGQATAANVYPGIIFDGGSGNCRAMGVDVAGHQPGMILRGSGHIIDIVGTNNLGDLIQLDGVGWSRISAVGTNNANGLNVISESGPNQITVKLNAQAAGATLTVSAATAAANIGTFTVAAHGYVVGQLVAVAGVTPAGYNGTWLILTVPNANTFTANIGSTPGALSVAGTSQPPSQTVKRGAANPFSSRTSADLAAVGSVTDTYTQIGNPTFRNNVNGGSPTFPSDSGTMLTNKTGGANPTAAAGANAGTGPPAPVLAGSPARGSITFGTGTGPAAGVMVTVTEPASIYSATTAPLITPLNAATAALQPYATMTDSTHWNISFVLAPAASQGNTIYAVAYWLVV